MNTKTLTSKVAIVTGAGSGIGKSIAMAFAQAGASIILADNRQQNIEAVADAIQKKGGQATCFTADISREEDVSLLMNFTLQTYDKLDILVNNAGIMDNFTPVAEVSSELWERVIGVNLNGPFYTCRTAVQLFLKQGSGTIINIASIGGLYGGRAGCAYTASKHGLIGLTRNIGYQYAEKGIRCNAIAPGGINTNILYGKENDPFGFERMNAGTGNMPHSANPDVIAELALFLASEKSYFVNGTVITADGGWTAY
ncbi:NAD(P)-dependent dehydrogenase, short-chain alcohol dehydrogenase family [Mucilaginibacter sp. OK268]|uniref:SDR family NAD(P)-dependent oxidoreductase n=1 Tax=Mucilaginibacter sp. OK268 TaxID=1881048 RepID=UPI000885685A|nr:SDR family NAD(P)-dependent oxidoreductase [Mucilaginibacter sp. OK268]SDP96949.1 NAD(P)-dependent dehydrogenase, short-chain alcohol dehydrogenase family [Mucilaginibacter sp. OK268]